MEHTKEPWEVEKASTGTYYVRGGLENERESICMIKPIIFTGDKIANAKRIVTCVNGMAGIPNEEVEAVGPELMNSIELLSLILDSRARLDIEPWIIKDIETILNRIEERRNKK